jgi:hypothetical protein
MLGCLLAAAMLSRREAILKQDELIAEGAPLVPPPVPVRPMTYRSSDGERVVVEPVRWGRRYYYGPSSRYYYGPGPRYYSGYRGYYYPSYYDRNYYYYGGPRYYYPYRYRVGVGPVRVYWR